MKILITLIYIVNIFLILSIIFIENKKPSVSLFWILMLVAFPFVGFILYTAFGMTLRLKMTRITKRKKMKNKCRNLFYRQLENVKQSDMLKGKTNNTDEIVRFNINYSDSIVVNNNIADIIIKGSVKFDMLFEDIKNAKNSINAQYFLIHNDIMGNIFIKRLADKAKEGVRVKVLYDGLANITTPFKIFKPLIEAGGEVKKLKNYLTHYRNHRKIVVIDGKIGYTGGMNIGDEYVNIKDRQPFWRDTHMRFEGDIVYLLQYYFLYDWFYINTPQEDDLEKNILMKYFPRHSISQTLPCQAVACGADYECGQIKMAFLKTIYSAKNKILIQTPYFIPNESIMEALIIMASSGVKIEIMLPSQANFIINMTNSYYISRIISCGVKVYLFKGYIHSKTLSVDGNVTSIGTANLDYRSMDADDELTVFFYDQKFTQRHENIFENDKKNCAELDYDVFLKRNYIKKGIEKLCRLFAPVM